MAERARRRTRPRRPRRPAITIVVRGPLGVGKTAVSRALARGLGAKYVSIDRILEAHALEVWERGLISAGSFHRANAFAVREARAAFARDRPIVVDGNFYHRSALEDLRRRLDGPIRIFTLEAPLSVCIARDAGRSPSYGEESAGAVYAACHRFRAGRTVDATRPLRSIVRSLLAELRPGPSVVRGPLPRPPRKPRRRSGRRATTS
jgi:predicted kinase